MTKSSGLAAGLLVGAFDVSGDTGAISAIEYGTGQLDVTGLDKSAPERLHGVRFGRIGWTSFFNDATGQAHEALSVLPDTDTAVTYMHRRVLGAPTFSMLAKKLQYNGDRAADGMFTFDVDAVANGFGLDMGHLLTAGVATSTGAESLTGFDDGAGAATAFGLQAFLHVTAFTGTSATITIEDAALLAGPYAAVPGAAFTAVTGATAERIETSRTETVDEFLRVTITGTYTNLVFAVGVEPNRYITVGF
jgi:hypothetical protein